jgi:regulator of sirC expression with transglutaminase-like and TPR domain
MPPCRFAFARLLRRPDPEINLAEAALLIAKEEYRGLDVAHYLGCLDEMAEAVRARLGTVTDPAAVATGLSGYLFRDLGFRGNTADYYDPRNSFLNEVLDRRLGIPITLSAMYIEVGRRLGVTIHGVGMPGHFLVKCIMADAELVIDPYNQGAVVTPADCQQLLDRISGGKLSFEPRFMACVGTRQILTRMLNNLKAIYVNRQDYGKALGVVERLLLLDPDSATEMRDRGLLLFQLKRYPEAMADLQRYLQRAGSAEDAETIRGHLGAIRQRVASWN